jgi:hypothetical protein
MYILNNRQPVTMIWTGTSTATTTTTTTITTAEQRAPLQQCVGIYISLLDFLLPLWHTGQEKFKNTNPPP